MKEEANRSERRAGGGLEEKRARLFLRKDELTDNLGVSFTNPYFVGQCVLFIVI